MCMIPIHKTPENANLPIMTESRWGLLGGEAWVEAWELTGPQRKYGRKWFYLDYGGGFTGVYICQNLSRYTL